jgi:hypothetical protein
VKYARVPLGFINSCCRRTRARDLLQVDATLLEDITLVVVCPLEAVILKHGFEPMEHYEMPAKRL